MAMDDKGQQIVAIPTTPISIQDGLCRLLMFHGVLPFVITPLTIGAYVINKGGDFRNDARGLYDIVSTATSRPATIDATFQNCEKLKSLWNEPSARHYYDHNPDALEYQTREGFCGSATERCVLKSLGMPGDDLPQQESRPTDPEKWCENIAKAVDDHRDGLRIKTEVVRGPDYPKFLSTLRRIQSDPDNVRVAVNYLRPALMGFSGPRYIPVNFFMGCMGGHFSPVVGIVDDKDGNDNDDPLVGVFDTNHKFGGAYLIRAKKLYDAVRTKDLFEQKYRALVVVEKKS